MQPYEQLKEINNQETQLKQIRDCSNENLVQVARDQITW